MKKFLFMALFAMTSAFASAQQIGVGVLYGTDVNNLGLGVKGRYNFAETWRGEANFNYYFKKNNVTFWDLNANVHYLFPINEDLTLYPLAGLGYAHASTPDIKGNLGGLEVSVPGASSGNLGVNLGGGLDYKLTEDLLLNAEVKFQLVNGHNQGVFSVGVVYSF